MLLDTWGQRWGIPAEAISELKQCIGIHPHIPVSAPKPRSEAEVQNRARLSASRNGGLLWRNNVGCLLDDRGVPVRYGLANESKRMNQSVKSSDLIGIRPVFIAPEHLGTTIGQFVAYECKHEGWKYKGDAHERAQLKFMDIVRARGGEARFISTVEDR